MLPKDVPLSHGLEIAALLGARSTKILEFAALLGAQSTTCSKPWTAQPYTTKFSGNANMYWACKALHSLHRRILRELDM